MWENCHDKGELKGTHCCTHENEGPQNLTFTIGKTVPNKEERIAAYRFVEVVPVQLGLSATCLKCTLKRLDNDNSSTHLFYMLKAHMVVHSHRF